MVILEYVTPALIWYSLIAFLVFLVAFYLLTGIAAIRAIIRLMRLFRGWPLKKYVCLAPGPPEIPPEAWAAMMGDSLHHRIGPYHKEIEVKAKGMLKTVLRAPAGSEALFYPASGTAMMEDVVRNLVVPGDKVIVIITGFFGERWKWIAEDYRADVIEVESAWGYTYDPEEVGRLLRENKIRLILVQATDTSTGVRNDLRLLGELVKRYSPDTLIAVDAVLEAFVSPINMAEEGINVFIGAGHKEALLPPGLGFVVLDAQAEKALERRHWPIYAADFKRGIEYARRGELLFTPPMYHITGLKWTLERILEDEDGWYREIAERACRFREKMYELGFTLFTQDSPSNGLSVFAVPEWRDAAQIQNGLLEKGFFVAKGMGPYTNVLLRIAHFQGTKEKDLNRCARKLHKILFD